jgi:hypothetical protein
MSRERDLVVTRRIEARRTAAESAEGLACLFALRLTCMVAATTVAVTPPITRSAAISTQADGTHFGAGPSVPAVRRPRGLLGVSLLFEAFGASRTDWSGDAGARLPPRHARVISGWE